MTWQIGHEAHLRVRHFRVYEPSGEIVFRVAGWLDSKRVRKNFPSHAEAKAEFDALEVQHLQGEAGVRPTVTRLSEDEQHEARRWSADSPASRTGFRFMSSCRLPTTVSLLGKN